MTTIFVFTDMPENHIRSFVGAMQFEWPAVYRIGDDFKEAYSAHRAQQADKVQAARSIPGASMEAIRKAEYAFDASMAAFIRNYYDADDTIHIIGYPDTKHRNWSAFQHLVSASGNIRKGRDYTIWNYHPYDPARVNDSAAYMKADHYSGHNVTEIYKISFNYKVIVAQDIVTRYARSADSLEPRHLKTTESYEWIWEVPVPADVAEKIEKLYEEINYQARENGYGGDFDLQPLYDEVGLLISQLG